MLDLLDQVEDVIAVDNGTPCNETACSVKSEDVNSNELPIRFNDSVERTKSRIPKKAVGVFANSSYLVLEVCSWSRLFFHWFFSSLKKNLVC